MDGAASPTLRRRALWPLLLAPALAGLPAAASDTPRLLVAYPAGGPADLVARQLAAALQKQTGQALRVENLPGAGGGLGVLRLLSTPGDWLVGTPSETIVAPLLNPVLGYRPEQLRLVGIASRVATALVGAPQAPPVPLAALLAAARQTDRPLVCGNYGVGSLAHLAALELEARSGTRLLHVPHAGVAPLQRELVAGRIEMAFLPVNRALLELVEQGRLRLLGLAAEQRDPRWPDWPTVDEATGTGGIVHRLWVGLFVAVAAGAAAESAARSALDEALGDPAYQQQKLAEGVLPGRPMAAGEAAQLHADEIQHYRRLVASVPR